jgi:hypothetical protein
MTLAGFASFARIDALPLSMPGSLPVRVVSGGSLPDVRPQRAVAGRPNSIPLQLATALDVTDHRLPAFPNIDSFYANDLRSPIP